MTDSRVDVVLFHPAPRRGYQPQPRIELPLSLLFPGTAALRQGFRVSIIDQYADPEWERKLTAALAGRPTCFGVTCMTGPQLLRAAAISKRVKAAHPDLPVVWGGVHPSLLPEQTLANPYVDIAVIGEGEATLPELVRALADGSPLSDVAGLCFRENGGFRRTRPRAPVDLESQVPLAYELLDMHRYRRTMFKVQSVSLNTSRGCCNRCAFCFDPVMNRGRWRAMGPEAVVEEMRRLMRDYGYRGFLFTDDNFFVDFRRARAVLERVVREDLGISIGKLHVRADTICRMDPEFIRLLVRAGVRRLTIGAESASPRLLDLVHKGETVETIREANVRLKGFPLVPHFLFMMGLPTETPEELRQSLRLALELQAANPAVDYSFNIYTPYPGTELYAKAVEQGLEEPDTLEEWASFNYRSLPRRSRWVPPETRALIDGLDFPLTFLGKWRLPSSYRKFHPLVYALGRLYHPIARHRVSRGDARFPLESHIVKALGLFGRQG